jgi:ABC-type nitrate/sulfonate/bicarbonate transport system permease component
MAQPRIGPRLRSLGERQWIAAAAFVSYWVLWEAIARAGIFYEGVVPSSLAILRALYEITLDRALYLNVAVTAFEVSAAMLIGCGCGLAFGLLGGAVRMIGSAYEPYIHYLAPTPKIVFLPVLLLLFGVGFGTKIALGALSAFFPMAIATLAGVRSVDPVLLRVGRSFKLGRLQMAFKIYLPALRAPVLTGLKLGFGFAVIGVLLAEIKLSNVGLGFMAIQYYDHFEMAELYALMMIIFVLAGGVNALIGRLTPKR